MTFRVVKMRKFKSIIHGIGNVLRRKKSMAFTDRTEIMI